MKREIIITSDGSKTIRLPEINENYHSGHGALQEAMHVFIESGLRLCELNKSNLNVLEVGFGTGLNTLLTTVHAQVKIHYTGLEAFPVEEKEWKQMGFSELNGLEGTDQLFREIHLVDWGKDVEISTDFTLHKLKNKFIEAKFKDEAFDLIYFDAFGPRVQPEMWKKTVFEKLYKSLACDGVLVTYCAKGQVRRDMLSVGFTVEKIPGPPGKREMLRATKVCPDS